MKTLAIVVICHGEIPIEFNYGTSEGEIFKENRNIWNFKKQFNIKNMVMVTLSKLGGVCYGNQYNQDVDSYVKTIKHSTTQDILDVEGVRNTEDLVKYLFVTKPKHTHIKKIQDYFFPNNFDSVMTDLTTFTIDKMYTPLVIPGKPPFGGFAYLDSNGFTGEETHAIQEKFKTLNSLLHTRGYLFKSEVLNELKDFKIDNLYYIDITCSAYKNFLNVPLNVDAVGWLNQVLEAKNIRGGKKIKNKRKSKKSKRNIKINRKTRKT